MKQAIYRGLGLVVFVWVWAALALPVEAGWAGKSVATFKADDAGQKPPAKTPYPLMFLVPEDTEHEVCLIVTKTWEVNSGKASGKGGVVWRENTEGTLEQLTTFKLGKKKFVDGESAKCKNVGPLEKGDLVELQPRFKALKNAEAAGDKLVVSLWQPPPGP